MQTDPALCNIESYEKILKIKATQLRHQKVYDSIVHGIDEDDHHLCRCQEMITNERICVSMC